MKYSILLMFIVLATACGHSKGELIDLREKAKAELKRLDVMRELAGQNIPIEQVQNMPIDQSVALSLKLEQPYLDSIVRTQKYIDSLTREISKY